MSLAIEMARLRDSRPRTKVEYTSVLGATTDISAYYDEGASFDQIKERAPDEIQAGNFDLVLWNHNDYFSEFNTGSLIYGVQYHGAKVKISQGFVDTDGSEIYQVQAVGFIDDLKAHPEESKVTLRCRDFIRALLDTNLRRRAAGEIPTAAGANDGNGVVSTIETKPFKTVAETWTLTCTTLGGDGTGIFSVVGSVTGSKGNATSGTEFTTGTGTGGIKFTISAGTDVWAVGDVFTFTTKLAPQWAGVNAGKIIWSVLTGYNWDTDTQEAWSAEVLALDHTKSSANTDLDYDAFVDAIATLTTIGSFNLHGYVDYEEKAVDVVQTLILLFLGSIFTAGDGRIKIKTYIPTFTTTVDASFTDANKITSLGYVRSVDEVINYVSVHYKKTNVWEFSGEEVNYNGNYVALNQASINKYKYLTEGFSIRWFATNGVHVQDFADKLVGKYAEPPLNIDFDTGLDALTTEIGDIVSVTDTKYSLDAAIGEISRITKRLDEEPATISLRVRRDSDLQLQFGFLGSSANEGDGLSPQNINYDSASVTDKQFCYIGQTGQALPDYRMF